MIANSLLRCICKLGNPIYDFIPMQNLSFPSLILRFNVRSSSVMMISVLSIALAVFFTFGQCNGNGNDGSSGNPGDAGNANGSPPTFPVKKCILEAHVIVLLDPTVKPDVFTMMKRSAMEAILSMDLSKSQVGIWQMTSPYKEELPLGPVTKETLIDTFKNMKQAKADTLKLAGWGRSKETLIDTFKNMKQAKADTLKLAGGKALTRAMMDLNILGVNTEDVSKAILYVAGSPSGQNALSAAEGARQSGVSVRGLAMGMNDATTKELIEMSGGQMNVFQLPAEDTKMTDGKASDLAEWFCKYATMN